MRVPVMLVGQLVTMQIYWRYTRAPCVSFARGLGYNGITAVESAFINELRGHHGIEYCTQK
jgi:hypothetical protein